ncbi:MAG: hypothetical protein LBR64_07570 [Dysgonamonadaceae bacterium]|nr:hypothetical protein [Dysgonamonadaceae bacterium]
MRKSLIIGFLAVAAILPLSMPVMGQNVRPMAVNFTYDGAGNRISRTVPNPQA